MEIVRSLDGEAMVFALTGRLDSYWAPHLAAELEAAIRDGADKLLLDFAGVSFMSSAGIGVLLRYYKIAKGLDGYLQVRNPVETVRTVFDLSGLTPMLLSAAVSSRQPHQVRAQAVTREEAGMRIEVYASGAPGLTCRAVGTPDKLDLASYTEDDVYNMRFPADAHGLGLGAFGRNFEECRDRFGEFLAVAGHVIHLPTDAATVPDFLAPKGSFVPELPVLYGFSFTGAFSHCIRFDPAIPGSTIDPLMLARIALEETKAETVGIVAVTEIAGLVGAALKSSPTSGGGSILSFPHLRSWLTFTAEPSYEGDLAIITAICTRAEEFAMHEYLRPMESDEKIMAHFHAAVAPYAALKKGPLDAGATISTVLEHGGLTALLHLVEDHRPLTGHGASQFVRGVLWAGAIDTFEA